MLGSSVRELLLPPGSYCVMPNAAHPRLYLEVGTPLQTWRRSRLYPAFRRAARLRRLALRLQAALGVHRISVESQAWPLGEFVATPLPEASSVVVLVGTPGPEQTIVVQLRNDADHVLGYLKYGELPRARRQLEHEYRMLRVVPDGLAPRPLAFGSLGSGLALLISSVSGRTLGAGPPPVPETRELLTRLERGEEVALERHPWVVDRPAAEEAELAPWLEALSARSWPVTMQHGDFAPWNVLRSGSTLRAIDWENGLLDGFPLLDVTHWLLQVSVLVRRWPPERARRYATRYLLRSSRFGLAPAEATAIVALAAHQAYRRAARAGHDRTDPVQSWRRKLWVRT